MRTSKETRDRLRTAGEKQLAELRQRYPIGTYAKGCDDDGYTVVGLVTGHTLNQHYRPLIEIHRAAFYPSEVSPASAADAAAWLAARDA